MSDEIIRIPPHSASSERAVLGGLMLAPNSWESIVGIVSDDDFYRADHRMIFSAIRKLAHDGEPYDAVTVLDAMIASGELSDIKGGAEYLLQLVNGTASGANVDAYARIVREKSMLRSLIDFGTRLACQGYEPDGRSVEEIISGAQRVMMAMGAQGTGDGLRTARDIAGDWWIQFSERYESGGGITGLTTPWEDITALTNGLQPGDLIVLAARPGMGKTIMAAQAALHVAEQGSGVAVFELEMSATSIIQRCLASHGRIPYSGLRTALLEDEHYPRLTAAMKRVIQSSLLIDDTPRLSAEQIVSRARRAHAKNPLAMIVIDHLQLMHHPRERGRTDAAAVGESTGILKGLAKELGLPVLLLSQLNRAVEARSDKRPTMADLRESGAVEQDADVVLMLYRDDYYHGDTYAKGVVEVLVRKNRDGESGGTVYLENRFSEMRLDTWQGPLPQPPERESGSSGWKRSRGNAGADKAAAS